MLSWHWAHVKKLDDVKPMPSAGENLEGRCWLGGVASDVNTDPRRTKVKV